MPNNASTALILYGLVTTSTSAAAILWVLWLGLTRAGLASSARVRWWSVTAAIIAAWFLSFAWLGAHSFFAALAGPTVPTLPFAVFLPIPIGVWYTLRNSATRNAVAAISQAALIGVQFYRVIGLIFVVYALRGELPSVFGYPAGYGDIAVGLLAIVSAWALATGKAFARPLAYLWNALGMLDLGVALTLGILTSPGPFHHLSLDHPNMLASRYPLVMIPVFLVPLSLMLHILSFWKLRQERGVAEHFKQQAATATP